MFVAREIKQNLQRKFSEGFFGTPFNIIRDRMHVDNIIIRDRMHEDNMIIRDRIHVDNILML